MERFEVSFEYDEQAVAAAARSIDFVQAEARKVERRQWINRWLNWPITFAMVYWAGVFWWYDFLPASAREGITRRDLVVAGIAAFACCGLWIVQGLRDRGTPPSLFGRLLLNRRAGRLLGPVTLEMTDEGISIRGQGSEVRFEWRHVEWIDAQHAPEHFVLWTRFGFTFAIPKEGLPEHLQERFFADAGAAMQAAQRQLVAEDRSITYEATAEDVAAQRLLLLHRARGRYHSRLLLVFSCLPFAVLTLILSLLLIVPWWTGRQPAWIEPGPVPLMVLSIITIAFGSLPLLVYRSSSAPGALRWAERQIRRHAVAPHILGQHLVVITPTGFHDVANGVDSFFEWKDFAWLQVWKRRLFLSTQYSSSTLSGFMVPQSAFPSETAFDEFAATAETYWQNAIAAKATTTSSPHLVRERGQRL